jgi:hypothetical protein
VVARHWNGLVGQNRKGVSSSVEIQGRSGHRINGDGVFLNAVEVFGVWRKSRYVIHAFVELCMRVDFDCAGGQVVVDDVLERLFVTEKDAAVDVRGKLGRTDTGGSDIDTTTEGTKAAQVGNLVVAHLVWGDGTACMRGHVVNPDEMTESIGPEFWRKFGANEKGPYPVGYRLVRAFDGSVLSRVSCTSDFDTVACVPEEIEYGLTLGELATLVEANIFVRALRCMKCQPMIQPLHGRRFGAKGFAIESATVVIGD